MVTKLLHTPNSLPLTLFFLPKPSVFPKSSFISLFSTTTNHSLSLTHQSLTYGPSLLKGKTPSRNPQQEDEEYKIINEDQFTRIFHITALRVPSKDCFPLENRLRGHLLNWPRIRNIARVPGDDMDAEIISLLKEERNESSVDSLNRRINGKAEGDGERLSPVLYREKLVKSFNARGFVRFKNLARISRPKKKRKREGERQWEEKRKECGRKEVVMVEVLEEEEREREEMKGLLGEGFKGGRKWKGSTRLLLLDERFKDKEVEELPKAIQVYHHC